MRMSRVGVGEDNLKKESLSPQIQQNHYARATEPAVCSVFKSDAANSLCLGLKIKVMRIDTLILI